MMMNNPHKPTERGSIFFFILIGVALFAALSYAVTQAMRIGTDSKGQAMGTAERDSTHVSDLMQFSEALKMRVFEMTTLNSVPDSKLDFRNDVYVLPSGNDFSANNNSTCGGANDCSVFSPYSSNGLVPMIFPDASNVAQQTAANVPKNGHGRVAEIGISGVGTSAPDLVFIIQGIRPGICNMYNSRQGITTDYDDTTTLASIGEGSNSKPDNFTGFTTGNSFGYGATIFEGKKSFCAPAIDDGQPNRLAIWQVLKIR